MPTITLRTPVEIQLASVSFDVPIDYHLTITFRDAGGKQLHEIEENVPEILRNRFQVDAALVLEVDLADSRIRNWPTFDDTSLAGIAPACAGAKTLGLFSKVADQFCYRLKTSDGFAVLRQDQDYVPDFMPGNDSDYVDIEIEIATGFIRNWRRSCTEATLQRIADLSEENPYIKASVPPAA